MEIKKCRVQDVNGFSTYEIGMHTENLAGKCKIKRIFSEPGHQGQTVLHIIYDNGVIEERENKSMLSIQYIKKEG